MAEKRLGAAQSYIADVNSTLKILTLNTGTTIQIEMFSGVDDQNIRALRHRAAGGPPWIIVNTATVLPGPNTIDVGGPAIPLTWYYLYIIADSTGINATAGLLSTAIDAPFGPGPTLPPGYDLTRRVGTVKTDGAGAFLEVRKFGQFALYDVFFSNVVYTGVVPTGPASVAVSSFVPATAERCLLQVELWDNVGAPIEFIDVYGQHVGPVSIGPTFQVTAQTANLGISQVNTVSAWVHTGGSIYIAGTGHPSSHVLIYVLGYWEDNAPAI